MARKAPGRSHRKGLSLLELFKMFPDEAMARAWFEDLRWGESGRFCPHCSSCETSLVKSERPMPYHCGDCRTYFSVKSGTVMQSSKLSLQKWVFGIYLMSTNLKGVSSMKLHRDLGITQKTAWMMAQKIRQGWLAGNDKLTGEVEIDETYIGGKEGNKHSNKRLRGGRGTVGKSVVVGAKQRNGMVKAGHVDKVDSATLTGFVVDSVDRDAKVYTDEHAGYNEVARLFEHESVNHSVGEYLRDKAHTNGIESFWALLKRGYHGTYHKMSPKHLHRYVCEFAGRHNVRDLDTISQMTVVILNMVGARLRYQDLVGKD